MLITHNHCSKNVEIIWLQILRYKRNVDIVWTLNIIAKLHPDILWIKTITTTGKLGYFVDLNLLDCGMR